MMCHRTFGATGQTRPPTRRLPWDAEGTEGEAEREIVLSALEKKHDWQVTRTAEALGLADHSGLLKIMRRHGLSKAMHRDA